MAYWAYPLEILEEVIDLCAGGSLPDYGTLTALALIGRAPLPRAQRNLYRHVVLTTPSQLHSFLKTIQNAARLGALVQELTLRTGQSHYVPAGALMPLMGSAQTMTLDIPLCLYPPRFFFTPVRVSHLCVKGTSFAWLRRLVRACLELRTLSVCRFPHHKGHERRASMRRQIQWIPDTVRFVCLEVLSMRS
ncbi:hypothetical protein BC628DRAFT_728432 [Trametes gibbosa]|nr:hypothetical protein BC628DRAFT_728432 [Trametes gibbosa]